MLPSTGASNTRSARAGPWSGHASELFSTITPIGRRFVDDGWTRTPSNARGARSPVDVASVGATNGPFDTTAAGSRSANHRNATEIASNKTAPERTADQDRTTRFRNKLACRDDASNNWSASRL